MPIIHSLITEHEVVLAGSGRVKAFLHQAFPTLQFVDLEGYNINYPDKGSMAFKMILQMPKVLSRIKEEHKELQEIINKQNIDLVISDNRFGLHTDLVPCVYITHQIHIQGPGLVEDPLYKLHRKYIRKFDHCWIPDFEGEINLSGELGHGKLSENCIYIGPLSRLRKFEAGKKYDYCALISGPEPQRTKFESLITEAFKGRKETLLILSGKPELIGDNSFDNIRVVSHQDSEELAESICSSEVVIARPGYSSLMDLYKLEARCIFVPTPGQTEQEYLATYHQDIQAIPFIRQKNLSWETIAEAGAASGNCAWYEQDFSRLIDKLW